MFKKILFLLCFILLSVATLSCSSTLNNKAEKNNQVDQNLETAPLVNGLSQDIALAVQNQDYRLLVTSTRSVTVPGLAVSEFDKAMTLCGKKYMANTGDVIKTEQARVQRKKTLVYMQQYNQKMWPICRLHTTE